MEVEPNEDKMTILKNEMLDHLSQNTEAFFKSQQLGEPDLTPKEKRGIAEDVLNKSIVLFLSRYGKYLLQEHLKYFEASLSECDESYEISFYLQEIQRGFHKNKNQAVVKNRRLEALKRLALEGEYFSEEQMKRRNPLLYEQLVGRFLTEDERQERSYSFNFNEEKLSSFLLERYDLDETERLLHRQQDYEDSVMEEEEDSSSEEEQEEESVKKKETLQNLLWGERSGSSHQKASDTEKKMLYEEFRSHMYSNFLQGKDGDFDYSAVDSNQEYDDMETEDRDEEEKYFDQESPNDDVLNQLVVTEVEGKPEDPLDMYMNRLEGDQVTQDDLNSKMESLKTSEEEESSLVCEIGLDASKNGVD